MLKRRYRLKSPALFKRTLSATRLCANSSFVAYGLLQESTETRFGFIVSTKVHKRATRRNKIKRWFREIIRKDILSVTPKLSYRAVVIIARQGMLDAQYSDVRTRLIECLAGNKTGER